MKLNYKIEGVDELIKDLVQTEGWLDAPKIDSIVKRAAEPLVERIKAGYRAGQHVKTQALVNSIQAFQRRRKGQNDPWFTYYVGPKYSGKNSLYLGGNAAHLLEYGTVERFRANASKGGAGKRQGVKGVYGARSSTGRVQAYGVIRRAYDEYSSVGIEFMKAQIIMLIKEAAQKKGLKAA